MENVVIRSEGLGKKYRIRHEQFGQYKALRDVVANGIRSAFRRSETEGADRQVVEDFWALRDVSFEVKRGEAVGIIGRNGAGKSTLLKVLSRITEPSAGRVAISGRAASLLEVGTGFHPELTGRENIYLNGAILGMRRAEIKQRFDQIVAFAEVEKFLDTPVKRYSSGMHVRLAFAVAAHLEPDILIVDEVLAVGDAEFQRKSLGKMGEAFGSSRTILFVSHNMQAVRQLCQRVAWLEQGRLIASGDSEVIINQYLSSHQRSETLGNVNEEIRLLPRDDAFRLLALDIVQDGASTTELVSGKEIEVRLTYDVLHAAHGLHVYFQLCDVDGTLIFESLHNGDSADYLPRVEEGSYVSSAVIPADLLAGRSYELRIQAAIHGVRAFYGVPPSVTLHVHSAGLVNRAYAGYETPGKLAPHIRWHTTKVGQGAPAMNDALQVHE